MLINTEYFSPVAKKGITKAPKGSYEYTDWWKEQYKRCIDGYSVGGVEITGPHYFYLNFWKIHGAKKKGERKTITYPRFLDIDFEAYHEIRKARTAGKHFLVAKKRQCGWSEKAACLAGHEFTFFSGSQTVIIAGQEMYAENTRNFTLRGLNDLAGTEFYKTKNPGTGDFVEAKYRVKNQDGSWAFKGSHSQLYTLTARNNSEVASRLSPSFVIYEECGRFANVGRTHGFVSPSLEAEGLMTGFALFIGTGGDMDEGIQEFSDLFYNAEKHNIYSYPNIYSEDPDAKRIAYFVPGWKYFITDDNGNSLEKESKEEMARRRKAALDSSKPQELIKEIIARPDNPDEIFMIVKGTRFNTVKLNAQRAAIQRSKNPEGIPKRAVLKWRYDGIPRVGMPNGSIIGVDWEYNDEGDFIIFFEPELDSNGKPKDFYYGGTDSYDKDEAMSSDSQLSTSIFNGRHKRYDARYTGRPAKAEEAHEKSFMLCMMYGARNLIEWSNISIFAYAERAGLLHMLKERPRNVYADVINSKMNNQYGVDPNTRSFWITAYADYIEDYSQNMWDIVQINKGLMFREKTEKGKKYNCDITIGASIAYVHYLDEVSYIELEEKPDREEKIEFVYFTARDGLLQNKIYK